MSGNGPSLLGRNWLKHIRLDWAQIAAVTAEQTPSVTLQSLLKKHEEIFRDELGTVTSCKAKLQIRNDAQPKFCKARSVPFALKEPIEQELDRLEASGIIKKVTHSEWAAPIVAVPCKVTINSSLDVDQYPLPKPDDLFATLAGGKKFTKLDLSQAYQQLLLDDESKKIVTINTHRGLYQYTRLPFGVASAPAMFQKFMDTILQGIPHVICYIDDILITGKDDADHLKNLEAVLQRLQQHGLRLKLPKCYFMKLTVDYLGHLIDAEGLHATSEKLKAIVKAPTPKNVTELRSFLGLVNYYGKFLPNLSTFLHPLNNLLHHDCKW